MALRTTTPGISGLLPADYGPLVVRPVMQRSVAAQVATTHTTTSTTFPIPIVTADPTAAWINEGDQVPISDPGTTTLEVDTSSMVQGGTRISRQVANSSDPAAQEVVGAAIARDITRKVDDAFFGALAAPAPAGLEALVGVQTVDAGAAWTNLDWAPTAQSRAEAVGANLTAFVGDPAAALALALLKDADGSNRPLLAADPTQPTRRLVSGVPLFPSPAVAPNTIWGLAAEYVWLILREDVGVEVDRSVFWLTNEIGVKATLMGTFAYPHPESVIKINITPV